jgi:hypothetical protein
MTLTFLPYTLNPKTNQVYLAENPNLVVFTFEGLTPKAKQRILNLLNFGALVANSFRCLGPTWTDFKNFYDDTSKAFYQLIQK